MSKIVVRAANSMDVVKVFRLLAEATDYPAIRLGRPNANKAIQFVLAMIQEGYVAVADLGGNVVGVCAMAVLRPPWTDDVVINLEHLYCQSKYRTKGVPRALLRNALREAGKHDLRVRVHLGDETVEQVGVEALEALGLRPAGRVFLTWHDIPEQEDAGLPDSGSATQRDDMGGGVDDDREQPDAARPAEPANAGAAGPTDPDEPWAAPV